MIHTIDLSIHVDYDAPTIDPKSNIYCPSLNLIMNEISPMQWAIGYYFTTSTGHGAYVTTPEATLPSSILLIPDLPLVPITMRFAFSCSA